MTGVTYAEAFARLDKVAAIFDRAAVAHLSLDEKLALKFLGTAPPPPVKPDRIAPTEGEEERPDWRNAVEATHAPIIHK